MRANARNIRHQQDVTAERTSQQDAQTNENDFRRARIFRGCRTAPLDFVISIREKRRGTLAASVIALVYWHRVLDDVYVRVHRRGGRLIYETCIDRRAVCIRQRARKRGRPSRRRSEGARGYGRLEEKSEGQGWISITCSALGSAPVQKERRFFKQIKVTSKKSTSRTASRRTSTNGRTRYLRARQCRICPFPPFSSFV